MTVLPLPRLQYTSGRGTLRSRLALALLAVGLLVCAVGYGAVAFLLLRAGIAVLL